MKKNAIKYLIDTLLFITISSIAAIGLMLGFAIPKGKVHATGKYFLGLHRHDWGEIHLYLSLFLLLLLIFHIWLNRTWIVQSTKRYFGQNWAKFLCFALCSWIAVLFAGWLMLK